MTPGAAYGSPQRGLRKKMSDKQQLSEECWGAYRFVSLPIDPINFVIHRYLWRKKTKRIFVKAVNEYRERVKEKDRTHTLQAISHHFAIPVEDLEKAVNDYKGDEDDKKY